MTFPQNETEPPGNWVAVAVLGRTRGTRGEVTAIDLSTRPERLAALREVWLFGDGARYEVESVWFHDGRPIFKFRGIDDIAAAEPLAGAEVRIPYDQRAPLEAGEFYLSDLTGCEVVEHAGGASLGRVKAVQEYEGPALLELEGGLLIPFARSICLEIDTAGRRIVVDLPEGLKGLNQP